MNDAMMWPRAVEISNLPEVHEALQKFSDDSTEDNAVGIILAVASAIDAERSAQTGGKPRAWFLDLATNAGARLTGKPDGSEPIEVVFSISSWHSFDAACASLAQAAQGEPDHDEAASMVSWVAHSLSYLRERLSSSHDVDSLNRSIGELYQAHALLKQPPAQLIQAACKEN